MHLELLSIESLICLLQKCKRKGCLAYAKQAHLNVCKSALEGHRDVVKYIVPMFVECGNVADAQGVFYGLVHRNEHSWTSLMLACTERGRSQDALGLYQKMQEDGVNPTCYTFLALLRACARLKDLRKARQIHVQITNTEFDRDPFIGSSLVDMYAKCGSVAEAQKAFNKLPMRDVVSWTALIAGYSDLGYDQEALKCFEEMQLDGISPNAIAFTCSLKACGSIGAIVKGRVIHMAIAEIECQIGSFVGNTLLGMYAKCGSLAEATKVFHKMPFHDIVSWNALIAGYAEYGLSEEALRCFEQMELEHIHPDAATLICCLKACSSLGAIGKGRDIHNDIVERGFETDPCVCSALIDLYAKCGFFGEALEVFKTQEVQDVVSWNALIAGYAKHELRQEVLYCFEQMHFVGVKPDNITFICTLEACGNIGAIDKGHELNNEIMRNGFEGDLCVYNALIDMYAKCGSLVKARHVFDELPVRTVVSWTAMIAGYGINGEGSMAIQCFEDMQESGESPNAVTLKCLLTACSHAGLVLKGLKYFKEMKKEYGLMLTIDHYTCMVDLLGRSGQLCEAERLLQTMGCSACEGTWASLLRACKTYGETEVGLRCFYQLVERNSEYAAAYALMASTYANEFKPTSLSTD